jgi:hypothetical protein
VIDLLFDIAIPITQVFSLLPDGGWGYKGTLTKPATGFDDYYSQWTDDGVNTVRLKVTQVKVNNSPYTKQTTYAAYKANDSSFYWDNDAQTIYIHYEFGDSSSLSNTFIGIGSGYSYRSVQYIDDIEYLPLIQTVPSIKRKTDKFQSSKMTFQDQTVIIKNGNAQLDAFIANPVPGSEGSLILYDTETSTQLQYYTGFVSADKITRTTATITLKDKRRSENVKIPSNRLTSDDWTNLEDRLENQIIPEGYSDHKWVEAYPLNGTTTSGNVQYKFATDATALDVVRVRKRNDSKVWRVVTPLNTDLSIGYFELSRTDATDVDGDGDIMDCVVDCTLRSQTNPGDIIADMNDRYNNIGYNSTSYNQTEWASEAAKMSDVRLYMDEEKNFFEWVEALQNGTNLWFAYSIAGDGKRTLRVSDPNRTVDRTISEPFKGDTPEISRDFSEYSSTVEVVYNQRPINGYEQRVKVDTYEETAIKNYGVPKNDVYETLLKTESTAQIKANVIAEDQQEPRPTVKVVKHEPKLSDVDLEIYDIVNIDTSRHEDAVAIVIEDEIYSDYSAADEIYSDYEADDEILSTVEEKHVNRAAREFAGTIRGQVVETVYDPATYSYTIIIRERPESEVI